MAKTERNVTIKFGGDTSDLQGSLDQVKTGAEDVRRAWGNIGTAMTVGVTVPLVGMATAATKAAIDYEDAFAGVRKTVDMTQVEYDELYASTIALSETSPVGATTLFEIEAMGGQLGIANDNLLSFAQVVAGMDIATDLNADEAATQMAQFANITGMSQGQMSNLGSTIVALGNNTATTESSIMAMAMRIAGAGSAAGMSEADILALSAALSSVGIQAEAGGSAISTIISSIDKAVALNNGDLATWAATAGMTAQEFAVAWRNDPVTALAAVISGMQGTVDEGGNLAVLLEGLGVTELRQTDALKRLTGAGDLLNTTIAIANGAWAENSALQNEVSARNETTSAKLQTLWNKVQNVAAELGGPLADALVDVIDALSPAIELAGSLASGFAGMDETGQRAVLIFAGLAAAAGPAIKGITGMASTMASLQGSLATIAGHGRDAESAVRSTGSAMRSTNGVSMASAVGEMGAAATAAGNVDDESRRMRPGIEDANKASTSGAVKSIGAVEGAAMGAASSVGGVGGAVDDVDRKKTTNVTKEVGNVASKADEAKGHVGGIKSAMGDVDGAKLSNAHNGISRIGSLAKSAASAVGIGLAGGLAGALLALGASAIITAVESAAEAEENIKQKAADAKAMAEGLEGALAAIGDENATTGIGNAASALVGVHEQVQSVYQGTLDLYNQLAHASTSTEVDISTIQSYLDLIESLSGKGELSPDEYHLLSLAVDEFNAATGAGVTILDANTGALSASNDELERTMANYATIARLKGWKDAITELSRQQAEAEIVLANAQSAYDSVTREQYRLHGAEIAYDPDATAAISAAAQDVADAQAGLDSTTASVAYAMQAYQDLSVEAQNAGIAMSDQADAAEESATATTDAGDAADAASEKYANASEEWRKARDDLQALTDSTPGLLGVMSAAGLSIDDMTDSMIAAGVSASDLEATLNSLASANDPLKKMATDAGISTREMAENLAANTRATQAWGSNIAALYGQASSDIEVMFVQYIESLGPEYADMVAQMVNDGSLPELAALWAENTQAINDVTVSNVQAASDAAVRISGETPGEMADALTAGEGEVEAAGEDLADAATRGSRQIPPQLRESARTSASDFATALRGGVSGVSSAAQALANALVSGINGRKTQATTAGTGLASAASTGIGSKSALFRTSGTTAADAFVAALTARKSSSSGAGAGLADAASSGASGRRGLFTSAGSDAGSAFSSGVSGAQGGSRSSGEWLVRNAAQGMFDNVWRARDAGSSTGTSAYAGLDSVRGWAWGSGSDFVNNFAAGMRAMLYAATNAAWSIASSISSILHFSEPEEGPLVGINDSGAEMVGNFAAGMMSRVDEVRRAAEQVASAAYIETGSTWQAPDASRYALEAPSAGTVIVQSMSVRNDRDIELVAQELHRLEVIERRAAR